MRLDSGDKLDCRRPRERNARCSKEARGTVLVRDNRATLASRSLAAHGRGPEPLTTTTAHKYLIVSPFLHSCGTVAEWLWRHV